MTVRILKGDCREMLKTLPDESVNCVVTSPPYFGLRDYGVDGQIGLEPTPEEFTSELVGLFREIKRVLRGDGTIWLNLGDSYWGSWANYSGGERGAGKQRLIKHGSSAQNPVWDGLEDYRPAASFKHNLLKSKDLIGILWRVALALQADGWWLRQDIIWSKPNPMPESVRDRCTKAHEYLFLMSKNEKYYYDQDAIAEDVAPASTARLAQDIESQLGSDRVPGKTNGRMKAVSGSYGHGAGRNDGDNHPSGGWCEGLKRNKRSVWEVTTQPFKEAHFATFPPALIEPCILAGCPQGGTVLDPFGGAGTTGLVADRLRRHAILIELNPEYAALAEKRILDDSGMFANVSND
jgi:DNA modification methylase